MSTAAESISSTLAREAAEAMDVASAEARGEREPATGQRARRQGVAASQVYSVRIPIDRLAQLRDLAEQRGVAPTALLRQFVLERLDAETAAPTVAETFPHNVYQLKLGPARQPPIAKTAPSEPTQAPDGPVLDETIRAAQ